MSDTIISNSFYEDDECNKYFFYTGKSNVLGLSHPDASLLNDRNYGYMRIALIHFEDSLLATDEVTVNESFTITGQLESSSAEGTAVVSKVQLYGITKGKVPITNTFKCICTPLLGDSIIPNIYITKEDVDIDGSGSTVPCIGIWLQTSSFYKIFVNNDSSISRSTIPFNEDHLDSRYYVDYLTNSEIESGVNTTSTYSQVSVNAVCRGVSINADMIKRITALENTALPNFKYAYVSYDEGFSPVYSGNSALEYQLVSPSAVNYSLANASSFLKFNSSDKSLSVTEAGTYMIQLSSGIKCGDDAKKNADVELSVYLDDTKIAPMTIQKSLEVGKVDNYSGNMAVVALSTTSKIKVKFKFGVNIGDSISNANTYLSVMRFL